MNNIEILEELINGAKEFNQYNGNKYYKAIENLIKEYKELKKPKYIIDCKTNEIRTLTNDFISKDKVKEKIDQVNKEYLEKLPKAKDLIEQTILGHQRYAMENVLQELLEEGE